MIKGLLQIAVPSAYLAAAVSILAFLALFVFFAGVSIFGPINDVLSILQFSLMIPAALAYYELAKGDYPALLGWATAAAVISLLAMAVTQLIFVLGVIPFEMTLQVILPLGVVLGGWWILAGGLALSTGLESAGLNWAGIVSGISFVLIAFAFRSLGPTHPVTTVAFLAGAVAVPAWAIWLGRVLQSQQPAASLG